MYQWAKTRASMQSGTAGMRIHRLAAATAVAVGAVVLMAAPAQGATCASAPPTVTIALSTAGETATIGTNGSAITLNNVACAGGATTANTDTINVTGTTGNETAVFDLTNGPLGPGATVEAGTSEIEINVNLGLSSGDRITVTGSSSSESFNLGDSGINLNGDDDADILYGTSTELFTVNAGGGGDFISAQGGAGSGSALTVPATLNGDTGDDTLAPGQGNDTIGGGLGTADLVAATAAPAGVTINLATTSAQNTGGLGSITMTGVENAAGSAFNDVLTGDGASNSLTGAGGDDRVNGAAGDDALEGGPGIDTADYSTASAALNVSLAVATPQDTGGFGVDTLDGLENLTGGTGADTLAGDGATNVLHGGSGNDVLEGRGGDDAIDGDAGTDTASALNAPGAVTIDIRAMTLSGAAGSDTLSDVESGLGSAFDDMLVGDDSANTLNGDLGFDTVDYSQSHTGVSVNLGSESASGGGGSDTVLQAEAAIGTPYDDTLTGGTLANSLRGEGGADTLVGAAGNDSLDGGPGADTASYSAQTLTVNIDLAAGTASGGAGDDTLAAIENLIGGASDDVLNGDGGRNEIDGGSGLDSVTGRGGDDSLDGGSGIDTVDFSDSGSAVDVDLAHQRSSGEGEDTLAGFENIHGSAYRDTLSGDTSANVIDGGEGRDVLISDAGNDSLEGGDGTDTVDYSGYSPVTLDRGVSVNLARGRSSGDGSDRLEGVENAIGSSADDLITGSSEANRVSAGPGADSVEGGTGNDKINGGSGEDRLVLGPGADRGLGGGGRDRLQARDGDRDRVDGGGGIDSARVDARDSARDRIRAVERVV